MEGFFTKKEVESKTRPSGKILTCMACQLYKMVESPRMEAFGEFKKKIMIIGEAPGEMEDLNGKPWQGKTGKLLQRTLAKLGIDLFEDCLSLNSVNCRPIDKEGQNRAPVSKEIDCCRAVKVMREIEARKPKMIILLGSVAVQSVIGGRWKGSLGTISKWRGWAIPDQDLKCWICPTFHPSYIERDETTVVKKIWEEDLKYFLNKYKEDFPIYKQPTIIYLEDSLTKLKEIPSPGRISFDYESTGLKPQKDEHEIICTSVAVSPDLVYVFMMPESRKDRRPFIDLLTNPLIEKMAHNMKFEDTWTVEKLRCTINNWFWDSMLAAHIIDNRTGVTGLKFQTYVNFGISDYSSEISQYLDGTDSKNANSLNRIKALLKKPGGKRMLMEYCALDSINEYRLAELQISKLGLDLPF